MEVEMGRSFLLADPNHQHCPDFPVLKFVKYKEERTSDALISKNVSGKENCSEVLSPTGFSEQGPGKALTIYQNGVPYGNKQVEQNPPKTAEATRDKRNIQSNEKPKMQSILRRTCSSTDTEERNLGETPKTQYEKGEQDSGGERELSWGKRAWEITQRRKAQMREEFFKVPYEECNREAARSLGGRLNKSEPRLHTLGKERKKRNSLSYKRRVHFDLDHCEDEDVGKPRCRSKSFEAPDPPKKVVVSIYSIDNKLNSIIQPDALIHCNVAGGVSSQAARQTTNTQSMNVRPTDLDSLQQIMKNVANRQQCSHNAEEPDSKTDRQARREVPQRPAPPTTTMQPSNNHEETLVRNDSTTKSENQTAPLPDDSHFSPVSPLKESSVRSRGSPLLPLQGAPGNAATPTAIPCSLYVLSRISSPPLEQLETLPTAAPVPAPRSRLTKSHSLLGHSLPSQTPPLEGTHQTSSQPPHPRPDHLNLNAPSSARTVMHVFTPAKTFMHPQRVSTLTDLDTQTEPPVAATENTCGTPTTIPTTTALLASATPIASTAPNTNTVPDIPSIARSLTSSSTAPHTPSTPDSHIHCATSSSSGPVPMPRKRISVSQQTATPKSPHHHHHHRHPFVTHTPTISKHNTFSPQVSASHHTHHNDRHHHHNNNNAKKNPPSSVDSQTSRFKTANSGGTFMNNDPPNTTRSFHRSQVYPEESNKENDAVRQNKKTTVTDRENCVNILMTKGESYAQHNIVISSHMSPAPPSVTVRKVFIPVSAPSRSSPSPTPSCASSSCSFGSSGSSSGCYSGSPSPTPTPSPTRIRASCVPTDL